MREMQGVHASILDVEKHGKEEVQRRLWKYVEGNQYALIAEHPSLTAEMLSQILVQNEYASLVARLFGSHLNLRESEMAKIRRVNGVTNYASVALLSNPNCPIEYIEEGLKRKSYRELVGIAKNPALPPEIWAKMNDANLLGFALPEILKLPHCPTEFFHTHKFLYPGGVLRNPTTTSDTISEILAHKDIRTGLVTSCALQHQNLTQEQFEDIISNVASLNDTSIIRILLEHKFITPEHYSRFANVFQEFEPMFRYTPAETLTTYAHSGTLDEVRMLSYNKSATAEHLQAMFERTHHTDLRRSGKVDLEVSIDYPQIIELLATHENTTDEIIEQFIKTEKYDYSDVFVTRNLAARLFAQLINNVKLFDQMLYKSPPATFMRNPSMPLAIIPLVEEKWSTVIVNESNEKIGANNEKIGDALHAEAKLIYHYRKIDECAKVTEQDEWQHQPNSNDANKANNESKVI